MTSDELVAAMEEISARPRRLKPLDDHGRDTVIEAAAPRRRQRTPIPMTDKDLEVVVERYRTIRATGRRDQTQAIAAEWNVSRQTASRWLRRARDLGLLEEWESN